MPTPVWQPRHWLQNLSYYSNHHLNGSGTDSPCWRRLHCTCLPTTKRSTSANSRRGEGRADFRRYSQTNVPLAHTTDVHSTCPTSHSPFPNLPMLRSPESPQDDGDRRVKRPRTPPRRCIPPLFCVYGNGEKQKISAIPPPCSAGHANHFPVSGP
jgi:hypothetical protein